MVVSSPLFETRAAKAWHCQRDPAVFSSPPREVIMDKARDIILITGATGNQGGAIARQLLSDGYQVRAMTRNPQGDKAQELAARGAQLVQGDLDDQQSLEAALAGAWGAYAVQNNQEGVAREEEQGKRFAESARKAGIGHFVYSSVGSADRGTEIPHFENKWRVEGTIRSLGFPSYTILRPVFFMENFLSAWLKPGITEGKLRLPLAPETGLQLIALEDIGKFGALAFKEHIRMNGVEVDLAGDRCTMPEVADIISRAMDRKVLFERAPIEEMRKMSEDLATMFQWFDRVGYDVDISAVQENYGIKLTTFVEWANKVSWK
jgi:uncharacterized protein YbjT (DUF2867 family)